MKHQMSRRAACFSLIEIMVALVIGLLVLAAVITFTVSSIRANTAFVGVTRLQSELRNTMVYIVGEMKRAGYDDEAFMRIGSSGTTPSPFPTISVAGNSCVLYAYDRPDGTPVTTPVAVVSLAEGELRGIRRVTLASGTGVVEVAQSTATATPACTDQAADYTTYPASCRGAWCPLTDPRVLNVTQLQFTLGQNSLSAPPLNLAIRNMRIWLQGRLLNRDTDVVRAMDTTLKVRADCVRTDANIIQCGQVPPT